MGRQGYISEFMNGGRILSHGKIESLANGFSLPNDALFSLYIRPKYSSSSVDAVLSVKLLSGRRVFRRPGSSQRLVADGDKSDCAECGFSQHSRPLLGCWNLRRKGMIASVFISLSRRLRQWAASRKQKKMRLNTASSVMFIATKGKTVFKFLNNK